MRTKEKMEIAQKLFQIDDQNDRFENPRFFRPFPESKMVERWEPKPGERISDLYRTRIN